MQSASQSIGAAGSARKHNLDSISATIRIFKKLPSVGREWSSFQSSPPLNSNIQNEEQVLAAYFAGYSSTRLPADTCAAVKDNKTMFSFQHKPTDGWRVQSFDGDACAHTLDRSTS
jgi:hypothetical protein